MKDISYGSVVVPRNKRVLPAPVWEPRDRELVCHSVRRLNYMSAKATQPGVVAAYEEKARMERAVDVPIPEPQW